MCQLGWWFQNNRTALHLAAMKGDDAITKALEKAKLDVQALLEAGLDVKGVQGAEARPDLLGAQDKDGRTALHLAAATGHREPIKALIDAAADTSVKDNEGLTPLALADKCKQHEALKLLCSLRAHGALIVAARKACADDVCSILSEHHERKHDVDEVDKHDRTALHYAAEKRDTQQKKDVEKRTRPLSDEQLEIVKALVKAKATVNLLDSVRLLLAAVLSCMTFGVTSFMGVKPGSPLSS
jgi:ankyrin repeat protein